MELIPLVLVTPVPSVLPAIALGLLTPAVDRLHIPYYPEARVKPATCMVPMAVVELSAKTRPRLLPMLLTPA